MCTVSIVPWEDGFRLTCNRDERRTRAEARPPRRRPAGRSMATYPLDPESGGTWVAVNAAGLAAAILNLNDGPRAPAHRAPRSRGEIVPAIAGCRSLDEALDAALSIDGAAYEPFRLVIAQGRAVAAVSRERGRAVARVDLRRPVLFTSSSLGDALVEAPRRALFDAMVVGARDWRKGQFRFHRHQWPDRLPMSVCMSRPDAATVSRTTIDATSRGVRLVYEPVEAGPSC
jgi:hypothetical protein